MQLKTFRHLWGVDEAWETVFPKLKALGYAGIECPLPGKPDRKRFRKLLDQHGFEYLAMIFTGGDTVEQHLDSFAAQVKDAKTLDPIFVNSHSGTCRFTPDEGVAFFRDAAAIVAKSGIQVCHELHRGRVLFHPVVTRAILEAVPQTEVCCDFSHWVNVCERLLDTRLDAVEIAAEHATHIHARVGYEEGPQVPDPRAPEYAHHVAAHETWWDLVWASQQRRGFKVTTITPEFGPPGYLHTLPHTNVPVANLWDICNWQAERQAARFAARGAAKAKKAR